MPKPNQQLINDLRARAAASVDPQSIIDAARALGERVRASLMHDGEVLVPLLAVQTHFSLLRGTAAPELWGEALGGLHDETLQGGQDRRGANHPGDAAAVSIAHDALRRARVADAPASFPGPPAPPFPAPKLPPGAPAPSTDPSASSGRTPTSPRRQAAAQAQRAEQPLRARPPAPDPSPWAALADDGDLLGLPAAIEHWGRARVAVGATVPGTGGAVVVLAPDRAAYARLCQLLSWRNEDADAWRRWLAGGRSPDAGGIIALVRDDADGRRWRAAGAEVSWRAGLRPEPGERSFPIACAPLLRHLGEDRRTAGVLAAISARRSVDPEDRGGDALADLVGLRERYAGYEDQLERGAALRARCRWAPGERDAVGDLLLHLPPLPPDCPVADADVELRRLAELGFAERYRDADPTILGKARARLERELGVIAAKHFSSYILTVWSIARGKRTCGRGSAAASIVCYCLLLTNVDPIAYELLFERFLSVDRTDPPDIDIDFAWDERDALFAEVLARFGRERVAMIATHQHLSRTGALREAGRAWGLPDAAISAMRDRLSDLADYGATRGEGPDPAEPPWPAVLAAAAAITGTPRHLGLHCGGVVITDQPIREIVPVHHAAKQVGGAPMPTIAWEKDGAENLGLVKIDLLGNRSLAVVRECVADLTEDGLDVEAALRRAPADERTRSLVRSGATIGCFYIESPAMRQLQAKVGSHDFDRLVVHSSIIRPAGNAFINRYIERYHIWKANGERVPADKRAEWYPHACLEQLISASFGMPSYQEDVMLIAQGMAGFTSKQANQLRKALGRSDTAQRLQVLAGDFDRGCRARGVAGPVIDEVWEMISSFAGYSFCKAHSASYAAVSFECAWLKAHHPGCFLARVIANEGGYYTATAYVEEARRLGVTIRGPCVLRSRWKAQREGRCVPDVPGALRLGLQSVKGLSRATADAIERECAHAPFHGLRDLRRRSGAAADELPALCAAGALDALLPRASPSQRAWLAAMVARDSERSARAAVGQALIAAARVDLPDPPPPTLPELPPGEVLQRRFACLGLLPDAHPLALWPLRRRGPARCRDVIAAHRGRALELVAWSISRKDVSATYDHAPDGSPLSQPRFESMAFVTLEDETALVETTWFPDTYRRYAVLLERREPLAIAGVVEVAFGFATLRVDRAWVVR